MFLYLFRFKLYTDQLRKSIKEQWFGNTPMNFLKNRLTTYKYEFYDALVLRYMHTQNRQETI